MPKAQSGLFRLNYTDFAQSAASAIFAAIIVALVGIVNQPDFNVFTLDWGSVVSKMINAAVITFIAFLSTQFVSADNGKLMGKYL